MLAKPSINRVSKTGIAQSEVIVGDSATAGEQLEGKLHWLKPQVALDCLEVLLAYLGSFLKYLDNWLALEFVLIEGILEVGLSFKSRCQGNGILHRELCA